MQGRTVGWFAGVRHPPVFHNRSKVGPEKCISEDISILDRYIYVIKGLAGRILNPESQS